MHYKIIISLYIILFISYGCRHSRKHGDLQTDLQRWNLKGNVKSVIETVYATSGKYVTAINFNEDGFVKEQASYNPDKSLIRKWVFTYIGDNLKNTLHCYVGNDSLSYVLSYHYDNTLLARTQYYAPGHPSQLRSSVKYDASGRKIRESTFDDRMQLQGETTFAYPNDSVVAEKHYDVIKQKKWQLIKIMNSVGVVVREKYLSNNGSLISTETYHYNEFGKLLKSVLADSTDVLVSTLNINYDDNDQITFREKTGLLPYEMQSSTYRYDDYQNWTMMTQSNNNKTPQVTTRVISYY